MDIQFLHEHFESDFSIPHFFLPNSHIGCKKVRNAVPDVDKYLCQNLGNIVMLFNFLGKHMSKVALCTTVVLSFWMFASFVIVHVTFFSCFVVTFVTFQ